MEISKKDLKAIGEDLGKRKAPKLPDDVAREMSIKEIIMSLAPKLLGMKRRKFTTAQIVAALKENRIIIDGATLNRYLSEYQESKKKKTDPDTQGTLTAKPKIVKSDNGRDVFTPKEEAPMGQLPPKALTKPDPLKELI